MVTGRMLGRFWYLMVPGEGRGGWWVTQARPARPPPPCFCGGSCPAASWWKRHLGDRIPRRNRDAVRVVPCRQAGAECRSPCPPSMGVRVMDTSWVARRGTSAVRKASSTPPALQPPAPPAELPAAPHSPIPEQSPDISATPSPPPSSFGFPPGAERTR